MIAHVRGVLSRVTPPSLVIEVAGLGYDIEAPLSVFSELPQIGAPLILYTALVVREDAHLLYGFLRESERQLFRALLRVTGVGPKLALAFLSVLDEGALREAIESKDIAALCRVPGVGRKTAERLLVELASLAGRLASVPTPATGQARAPAGEAVAALVALGYREAEAGPAVRVAAEGGAADTEALVRGALRQLAR